MFARSIEVRPLRGAWYEGGEVDWAAAEKEAAAKSSSSFDVGGTVKAGLDFLTKMFQQQPPPAATSQPSREIVLVDSGRSSTSGQEQPVQSVGIPPWAWVVGGVGAFGLVGVVLFLALRR